MPISFKKTLKKILVTTLFKHIRSSYAQSGEDIIISDLFSHLNIQNPTYLDIGANDPIALSNTYRLYKRGSKGVCVEPNPVLCKKIQQKRKRDTCLNVGVAFGERREADFYAFPEKFNGLNTFSKEEADFWEHTGNEEIGMHKVEKVIKMKLVHINEIIEQYFSPHPNLVSIDVEGLDFDILKSLDFSKYKPEVFCIETLGFIENNKEIKKTEILDFLKVHGYFVYADTYINTVFCLKSAYKNLA
ncbi:MAG: FkbM family methyltransferase [Chitinophagaceae bacterium]|nr:FkbM family methyltransferase [Chitinophagaceae bacterium]